MNDVLQHVDTTVSARLSLLGEPWAECLQYTAWQPVSSSLGLCAPMPWQPWATHSLPVFPARS